VQAKQRLRLTHTAWRQIAAKIDATRATRNWAIRLSYAAAGIRNSVLARLQSLSQADALQKVEVPPPLFLLGFWRSGTTFLHELFSCDPSFGFPSTYACLNPSHFLLTEKRAQQLSGNRQSSRPMDNLQYSWASPQEDDFALLDLGAPSPYEALIAPSLMRYPRKLVDLRQRPSEEQACWKQTLQLFLRLLTLQQHKPMVLKSPPHGFKLPLLPAMFPGARFVIIDRNPYEVFASNLKLWSTLQDMYSLEVPSPVEVEQFVLESYLIHEEAIAEGSRDSGRGIVAWVRYEDLVSNPLGEMERLYGELGLAAFDAVRPAMLKHVDSVAGYKRNHFVLSPSQKAAVDQHWGAIIQKKDYAWSGACLSLSA